MNLLTYSNTEVIIFPRTIYTYEKRITKAPCYEMQILRKTKDKIQIEVNYQDKTIKVNGRKFTTSINREFTYKKIRGNNIEVSGFESFISYLKESAIPDNVFYYRTEALLLNLTPKNTINHENRN